MVGEMMQQFLDNQNLAFATSEINLPVPSTVGEEELPHVRVGDTIFALKTWLMNPYTLVQTYQIRRLKQFSITGSLGADALLKTTFVSMY